MSIRARLSAAGMAVAVVVLLSAARPQASLDIAIEYSALQRMLAEQVFTQEGRRYVKGDQTTRCSFGYLEQPQISAEKGRLRVKARFSGRSALDLFGHCVGFGDAFDVLVTATPYFAAGAIRLKDVAVDTPKSGYYPRRVCAALADSLPQQFEYPVLAEARRAIEQTDARAYRRELRRFDVSRITVRDDALVLSVDLELTVK